MKEIRDDEYKYLSEHHAIMESYMGMAKLALKRGNSELATSHLEACSNALDNIIVKYCPATARLSGLIN